MKMSVCIVALTALVAVEACSQPAGWVAKDLRTMAREADLVVGGEYVSETVTKLRKVGPVTIIQKVVDSTFRVTSVYSRSPSDAASSACVPKMIKISNVQVVTAGGCPDFRHYWRVGGNYVVALSYQNGVYRLYDPSQLCMWSLNADNERIAQSARCGSNDDKCVVKTSPCPAAAGGSTFSASTTASASVTATTKSAASVTTTTAAASVTTTTAAASVTTTTAAASVTTTTTAASSVTSATSKAYKGH